MRYTIDLQAIANQLGFDVEDVEMIMDSFYEQSQISLQAMQRAIEIQDFEEIKQSSHAIKGSALNLSLHAIAKISQEIEFEAIENKNKNYHYLQHFQELKSLILGLKEKSQN